MTFRCFQQTFEIFDITQQCFASIPNLSFPANNLNFTEGDGIKSRLSSEIFSPLMKGIRFCEVVLVLEEATSAALKPDLKCLFSSGLGSNGGGWLLF